MTELPTCLGTRFLMADNFQELSWEMGNLGKHIIWIFDSNTALMVRPLPEPFVILEPGKDFRKFASVQRILDTALDNGLRKDTVFLATGGSALLDIAGFAAAIWMYGSRLVLVPTTLSSMTDSCIGGKVGFDFRNAMDAVGTFYPAERVLLCVDSLKSLPRSNFNNGFSGIVKHAFLDQSGDLGRLLILDRQKIMAKDPDTLRRMITLSISVKQRFIAQDNRMPLGLGQTFGYSLEAVSGLKVSHGQALAWGLGRAAEAAIELGICTQQFGSSILRMLESYGFDNTYRINRASWQEMRSILYRDRKYPDGSLRFILPQDQGKTVEAEVPEDLIKKLVIQNVLL